MGKRVLLLPAQGLLWCRLFWIFLTSEEIATPEPAKEDALFCFGCISRIGKLSFCGSFVEIIAPSRKQMSKMFLLKYVEAVPWKVRKGETCGGSSLLIGIVASAGKRLNRVPGGSQTDILF
jgi:hypothetical protein